MHHPGAGARRVYYAHGRRQTSARFDAALERINRDAGSRCSLYKGWGWVSRWRRRWLDGWSCQKLLVKSALSLEGEIRSREDVLGLLLKICQFYERAEPSSPVPLVLKRAARLAEMDFMQIMQDLSPDAISQIRIITGEKEPEEG